MIKLELPVKPDRITPEFQAAKTQEFIATGNSVWNIDWLKEAVFNMAFGKCCYSEIRLNEESKYMEVEHFHPKVPYTAEVMQWGNLLPASKKCNTTKGSHDTITKPIVNPFVDNPKDFFIFKNYRYSPKNEIAKRTIEVLALNDRDHFVNPRFRIGNEIIEMLENFIEDIDNVDNNRKRNRYISRLKSLLGQGNRKEVYSALVSTTILSDENYIEIEKQLIERSLWDAEFKALKLELEFCALL
jgi:uncharacterized protein (TIGR02646 family)